MSAYLSAAFQNLLSECANLRDELEEAREALYEARRRLQNAKAYMSKQEREYCEPTIAQATDALKDFTPSRYR